MKRKPIAGQLREAAGKVRHGEALHELADLCEKYDIITHWECLMLAAGLIAGLREAGAMLDPWDGCCPSCGGQDFVSGPEGGMSINIECMTCHSRLNATPRLGVAARIPYLPDIPFSSQRWVPP